ncbi:SID1 transmembrane family member 1-like isoform X1 [Mya arenaria]|uniref:SID1 transmembrane family member 1-like isoform X1 n=1 Tax=Mya arenaria TaxID=6604 RepID=UPI0022E18490|nr:SID1 transmembrane family member 1-like isoform X1 [Mya arenaria]XP_052804135.1 SID1 transmembrane family member 1-like isoform X1 [Mya arenaria]
MFLFKILMVSFIFRHCLGQKLDSTNKETSHIEALVLTTQADAEFNVTYTKQTIPNDIFQFQYTYEVLDKVKAVRLYSNSLSAEEEFPVMFVIREERSVMSWQIPLILHNQYKYREASRTLCPEDMGKKLPYNRTFTVAVSSQSSMPVNFTLKAEVVEDFVIQHTKTMTSSPSSPVFFMYKFPDKIDSVLIRASSQDKKCAILSIQTPQCPIFDLDTDVEYQGKYQTMTTQGAITVNKEVYTMGKLIIVIAVKPNDDDCSTGGMTEIQPAGLISNRQKNITISITETIPKSQYYKAILAALGVFLFFYLVALIIGIYYHGCKEKWGYVTDQVFERSMSLHGQNDEDEVSRPLTEESSRKSGYGAINDDTIEEPDNLDDNDSVDSSDFDKVDDANHDKNILRTKTRLFVHDLARKSEKKVDKNYKLYAKNLFTIAIFYGLPVIQLVMTYQKVLNFTGNQDICYYNFACAHPLGRVSSFNNIFSNIGYVMLGILFVILVKRREYLHMQALQNSQGRNDSFGIPQHFGLFYAMGMALCMEGVMSACYHVCPTVSNFQFDTSFMYIMAVLCILKIYQNRHTDISAKAHSSYLVMAVIIIVAVVGVVYGTNIFWIVFAVFYMLASLFLSIHLYYMGQWQLDRYIFKRLWLLLISDWIKCRRPVHTNRLILLLIGNVVNWAIAIYGVCRSQRGDFASYLLGIFIGNLLLYTSLYIVSKIWAKEKIAKLTIVLIVLSMVTWTFALYFFLAHLTSWQLSPAGSREGNRECVLLQFYDKHDIWHFLSAISLFFSFLVILTLDDEIILQRRDQIPVF